MKTKLIIIVTTLLVLFACSGGSEKTRNGSSQQPVNTHADTLIYQVWMTDGYGRSIPLIDSLAAAKELSPLRAEYYRGVAYVNIGQRQKSIDCFLRATADENPPANDADAYISAGTCLAEGLFAQEDLEGALRTALALEDKVRQTGQGLSLDIQRLYTIIGFCQIKLQRPAEAAQSFEKAYQYVKRSIAADTTGQQLPAALATLQNIATGNLNADHAAEAEMWYDREDSLLAVYSKVAAANPRYMEVFRSSITIGRAQTAQALGRTAEAARYYADYAASGYGQSDSGRLNGCDFLMAAHRYTEAADNYTVLDRLMLDGRYELDLENLATFVNKLRANYYAGRRDSALRVAMQIAEGYDSAVIRQKQSKAAELATIYDTQGKERQIAQQQNDLLKQRIWGIAGLTAIIIVFFFLYDVYRRRARKRLAAEQAARERIEGELRIARNIQMSMVPGYFPDREGLDLYAEMSPAKAVGGDLYGYVMKGDQLYFCVGDVSGKGVPASLFMAQASRLFHTFAKEGMTPTDIAFRMNNELVENNDINMFVTMFIGLADLRTGQMSYCNCGHNPPVIDGEFLEMANPNTPLGIWEDFSFQGETVEDIRGRQLLVYTDGLNEAENQAHEYLGNDRLLQLMENTASFSASQVIEKLTMAVEQFRDGAEPNDDLTMMCLIISPLSYE